MEEPIQPSREKSTIVHRSLPTLKELLPPVIWSPSGERAGNKEGAVRLDTREPKYISYFTSIKRAIELVWEYPEPALRHGLQGKLVLEFTILRNGNLEGTRLIRSSGFSVLDQEALRAVKTASPFHPIPPWIGKTRLDIIASFEYYDNRLKYGLVP
ncbi:MAG: energy transducer TonB [Candidatus Binatia bacterium]